MKNIENYILDYEFIASFDQNILKTNYILPLYKDELYILCFSFLKHERISTLLNKAVKVLRTYLNEKEILFYLQDLKIKKSLYALSLLSLDEENNKINDFLSTLFFYAYEKNASDIHFDVNEKVLSIKFRIDGLLLHYFNYDKKLYPIISSVLKLYSSVDITQRRKPINGRFSFELNDKKIDFRLSTMPTIFGESIVLRVLDNLVINNTLENLGFCKNSFEIIKKSLTLTNGIILVTGPTGSGKTTTLYAMLKLLKNLNKKIITIEDPVEYKVDGIVQVEINEKIGLTYNEVLKNILRQDPDIILIGEIRDELALNIAMQASLTGHLVLASLHTNSSLDTINRLKDLKAPNYLISNTIKTIISQRLVLKYCIECKNVGCKSCNFTGFKNREVLSETLYINEKISKMLLDNCDTLQIEEYLKKEKFLTLLEDGNEKVKNKITNINEINRVLKQHL